ncbi:MAG: hypothetical protein H7Y38_18860 [Armatimonadetes bacterium]|nr:hypothetical protein [Armatimonadota bacterium]
MTVLPYIFFISLGYGIWANRKPSFSSLLSGRDVWWLSSPTLLALAMLLFAASHRGFWRNPVNEGDLLTFHLLTACVVPLNGYMVWRLRRMWLITTIFCLPQLWQVAVSWFIGGMAITGRWI